MKPRLIVAILVIAGLPVCAEAQQPSAAKAKADAQKVVKMIIADKLYQQVDELATKLGPEYIALMNGLQDMDPDSEEGKEIGSTLEALDNLCAK